jgi:diguanylate cyclase (GGDEF)-like protein
MKALVQKQLPAALLRADNLPSLPAVALEVLQLAQNETSTIDDLARCLSRDPALAAKLLKLANSSLFSMGKEVSTLQRATLTLGMKTVKLMSLSFSLASTLPASGRAAGFDLHEYWRRSLVRSVVANALAKALGSGRGDEAFLCGLLGNLGRLALARALPEIYEPVVTACRGWPTPAEEEERLGFSSTDVCAALLGSWRLPRHLVLAVSHAERAAELPGDAPSEVRELVEILELTGLAEAVLCDAEKGAALRSLRERMHARTGLADVDVDALLVGLEGTVAETAELLSLELSPSTSHAELIEQARMQMVQVGLDATLDLEEARRANARLEEEARHLASEARTDRLTGLPNRAAFDELLGGLVARRIEEDLPLGLGLILLDLDHFKAVNDTYGHAAGDEVLRGIGRVLRRVTRKEDFAARIGGEEFALLAVAERVRQAIAAEVVTFEGRSLSVTASVGGACVVVFTAREEGLALVKLADHHLYRAKQAGRNRCEIYPRVRFPGR